MRTAFSTDLETVAKNSARVACTDTSDIVQIATIPVDLARLEMFEDESLNIVVKPKDFDSKSFRKDYSRVIDFHCKNMNMSEDDLMDKWSMGMKENMALKELMSYVKEQKNAGKPALLTFNGKGFDDPIIVRKCKEYKITYPFMSREHIDVLDCANWFFRYAKTPPRDRKLTTILEHFGMTSEGAHDALVDVKNTANVGLRFLKVQKALMAQFDQSWVKTMNGANALSKKQK